MILKENTYKAYSGIAKYCRTGDVKHIENLDLRQERMHHYRRLVFNITKNTIKQAYPICYKLLTDEQWSELINDFFENHDAQEFRIWMMPKEFYEFVKKENYSEKYAIPFLDDLLLFEWIEIELHTMEDEKIPNFQENGDLWNDNLVLNSEFRLLQLEYPVHFKKTKEISTSDKGSYFLFAYRVLESKSVKFMNLSVLFAYIIEQIEEKLTLSDIYQAFCKLTQSDETNKMKIEIENFINKLLEKKVVLGFSK